MQLWHSWIQRLGHHLWLKCRRNRSQFATLFLFSGWPCDVLKKQYETYSSKCDPSTRWPATVNIAKDLKMMGLGPVRRWLVHGVDFALNLKSPSQNEETNEFELNSTPQNVWTLRTFLAWGLLFLRPGWGQSWLQFKHSVEDGPLLMSISQSIFLNECW